MKDLRARGPASLAVCTLLDKSEQRVVPVPLTYIGFSIPDEFVVGYGLDYRELHRNLPFLAVLKRQVYESAEVGAQWNAERRNLESRGPRAECPRARGLN